MIASKRSYDIFAPPPLGELSHAHEVDRALGIQDVVGSPTREEGKDDPREHLATDLRCGWLRLVEPTLEISERPPA